jgi:hypothetical protein
MTDWSELHLGRSGWLARLSPMTAPMGSTVRFGGLWDERHRDLRDRPDLHLGYYVAIAELGP